MKQDFDFKQVGKKMPYTVPDDFFGTFEDKMVTEVTESKRNAQHKKLLAKWIFTAVSTAAAAIALVLILNKNMTGTSLNKENFSDIENAFCQLTPDDQAYLLEIYESDIFINE